nr:DUF4271 domain-containing protein [uncultured Lacinutrix sp.]
MVCLLLVAITKLMFPKRFQDFIYMLFNFRYLKIYGREQKFLDLFEGLLFTNLVIGLSIFSLNIYKHSSDFSNSTIKMFIFKLAIAIALFILIKVLIERIISSILSLDFIINNYIFEKISYKNFLGILLIPINAIMLFSFTPNKTTLLIAASILIAIHSIGLFFFFKNNLNLIKKHIFYFILYLCALEISPYVILYKSFTKIQGN